MSSSILTTSCGFDTTTPTSSRTSHSSSSLSESTNSPVSILNRKPRTPRKRPNQTYNEAAVLLSIACPKVFQTKNGTNKNINLSTFTAQSNNSFHEPPELLLPFPVVQNTVFESKVSTSPGIGYRNCYNNSMEVCEGFDDDFETESILDEEIEQGIDSIMGSCSNLIAEKYETKGNSWLNSKTCYGYPMGLGFGANLEFNFGFGMRNGIRALKNGDGRNWWSFPAVNVVNVSSPVKAKKIPVEKKKKKVEELMKKSEPELGQGNWKQEVASSNRESKLLLKLNYDDVLNAWSDKGSPLPEEISGLDSPGSDIHTKLSQIDLFSKEDGLREASVIGYKEKKHTRLHSKKIRCQVRKGRFVKT
ncbi:hypothetical protein QVD17_27505 [Tagetes erecta]|uniref:Uncharacterized protein n=1 Tax=Tagetes erecta TaxID=13708 RepID=A0AAD8KDB1_TARER|nr:hypothetical protein QVD17_27505 [Tagetes erecta]